MTNSGKSKASKKTPSSGYGFNSGPATKPPMSS